MNRRQPITSRNILLAITLLAVILMVFTFEAKGRLAPLEKSITHVVIPVQKGVTYFGDWLREQVAFVKNINQLEQMNDAMATELDQLRYENRILEQNKLELQQLRALLELDKRYAEYPKVGARIIGKDPGSWYEIFIIDKGSRHGLEVNMVVLAGDGLVGRIVEVGNSHAKVKSIIDDTSSVSGKILRTSDLATVKGDKVLGDQGLCLVEYIAEDAHVVEGDEMVTSHLGQIYPPGITIGTIRSIESNPHKLTKTAVLEPVVNFKHLEEVLVITQLWGQELQEAEGKVSPGTTEQEETPLPEEME
ncbi:rod shape-determining protein MreC [Anaerotalea alkaliphila]|uniref:Cell shape-determining protein MreC n=1 Tax=Anaerotalea alkaliphila TaxID=2662126 RepID=A0A7X5HWH2_9FIRM|nr:rod shape-determining protein MreC [Anaerotalea alkaliphila]NDL67950.1 rod shape-determining protein MreC [Anaerotalea alkaliphila]